MLESSSTADLALADAGLEQSAEPDQPARPTIAGWFRRWLDAPVRYEGIFSARTRRLGLLYAVGAALPVVAASALFHSQDAYIVMWSLPVMVTYGVPIVVVSLISLRREPGLRIGDEKLTRRIKVDRRAYLFWLTAIFVVWLIGLGLLAGVVTGSSLANGLGIPAVTTVAVLLITGVVRLTRCISGQRRFVVDIIEAVMAVLVLAAPFVLIWGEETLRAEESWFTIPAGLAFLGWVFGTYWVVVLALRIGPKAGAIEWCGMAFTMLAAVNAAGNVAQGLTDFSLPAPPLVALQAGCGGLALLVPLNLRRKPMPGLDRLPPHAQVRVGYISTLLMIAGLPALVVATVAVDDHRTWATPFALGVATVLVLLAGLRHLFGMDETKKLYTRIERASDQRRRLLAEVMQRADKDRHRVAAELHQQAVAAYTSVVSLLGAYRSSGADQTSVDGATSRVRDDLAEQVEALRHLMLAVKPLEADRNGGRDLSAPIQAYLDNLYGDRPAPLLIVDSAPDLYLDWSTETIALRIVQEALRNVWRHSEANSVRVTLGFAHGAAMLEVVDDGVGFDGAQPPGAGIAAMRVFAQVVDGSIEVESTRHVGTTVTARLGGASAPDLPHPLRLIPHPS
jgi:signal transduction histidine kinase